MELQIEPQEQTSGNATAEVLSPVVENANIFTPDQKTIQDLNNEIAKIHSRRESVEVRKADADYIIKETETVETELKKVEENTAEDSNTTNVVTSAPKKERKISRFKVSVVTEPDVTKLNIPETSKSETGICSVITKAYDSLVDVVNSYPPEKGNILFTTNYVYIICFLLLDDPTIDELKKAVSLSAFLTCY